MAPKNRSVIWRRAGRRAEELGSADDVVRDTGWVFNNVTGEDASLDAFVAQGDAEVDRWFEQLDLVSPADVDRTIVEIGSGIGRMTAALTRRYARVLAADIDPSFLERCRETVARFGNADRLETSVVLEGRVLQVPDGAADIVFSYITLQHCPPDVALDLVAEAARVLRPGGTVALNFRTWATADVILWPAGHLARLCWRWAPTVAERSRLVTRFGWQANRLGPSAVLERLNGAVTGEIVVFQSAQRRRRLRVPAGVDVRRAAELNPAHWFLVVRGVEPLARAKG